MGKADATLLSKYSWSNSKYWTGLHNYLYLSISGFVGRDSFMNSNKCFKWDGKMPEAGENLVADEIQNCWRSSPSCFQLER